MDLDKYESLCDAEKSNCIALEQEAGFMLKQWVLLLLGWINRWEAFQLMLHQELWKERLTKFENAEIRKKLRFLFSPSVFQEKDTKEIF